MPDKATIEEGTPAAAAVDAVNKQAAQKKRNIIIISVVAAVILILALVLGLVFGLRSNSSVSLTSNLVDCVTNYDANVDYFPEKLDLYVPNPNFQVKYFKNYKVITNTIDPKKVETIVLYQCGTPKPDVAALNATHVFSVPIKKISAGDTTSVTYLELLGVRKTITYTDSLEYILSPCILAAETANFGPKNLNTSDPTDFSALNATDVVALDYLDSVSAKATGHVTFPATVDTSGYGRIAWLGFLGAFYNLEAKANNVSRSIADNYNCLKTKFSTGRTSSRPTVAFVSHLAAMDYTLGSEVWQLNRWSVYQDYIRDAGGQNISTSVDVINAAQNATIAAYLGTPYVSYFTNATAFLNVIRDVDILIDEAYFYTGPPNATDALANYGLTVNSTEYKFVANKAVYRIDKTGNAIGSTDWYESAVVQGNVVLSDLVTMINGASARTNSPKTTYFRNVFTTPLDTITPTAADCPAQGQAALDVPYNPVIVPC